MVLTVKQRAQRDGKLTASRVGCLMRGDAEAIHRLWLEMTGGAEEEDLSGVWAVRLGEATEALNLDWYAEKNGHTVSRRGDVAVHPHVAWAAATLDGWIDELKCPIEAKCVQGREPLEVVIERYQPQMHWQMMVTGASRVVLSVILGGREPVVEAIDRDAAYGDELMARATLFMEHVTNRTAPVRILAAVAAPAATRTIDMSGNELWRRHALQWLQVVGAADTAKECEKILKALVPDDARKVVGAGVRITRDRAGRLSLRADNDNRGQDFGRGANGERT